jgi:hypothetical protein
VTIGKHRDGASRATKVVCLGEKGRSLEGRIHRFMSKIIRAIADCIHSVVAIRGGLTSCNDTGIASSFEEMADLT